MTVGIDVQQSARTLRLNFLRAQRDEPLIVRGNFFKNNLTKKKQNKPFACSPRMHIMHGQTSGLFLCIHKSKFIVNLSFYSYFIHRDLIILMSVFTAVNQHRVCHRGTNFTKTVPTL